MTLAEKLEHAIRATELLRARPHARAAAEVASPAGQGAAGTELGHALGPRHRTWGGVRAHSRAGHPRPGWILSPPQSQLINDQTLENTTGVGAPPWTWPVDEQVIDLLHKAIYAYVTGAAADRLVQGPEGQERVKSGHHYPQER
jgi:hypothetical protein